MLCFAYIPVHPCPAKQERLPWDLTSSQVAKLGHVNQTRKVKCMMDMQAKQKDVKAPNVNSELRLSSSAISNKHSQSELQKY
mmetsp:Transcript_23474/g.61044  ORF Transcript_23474/g.61044 Transcript_23474/m.61044 type:complete len:82 (+) Transcript_23474:1286-1531(+)